MSQSKLFAFAVRCLWGLVGLGCGEPPRAADYLNNRIAIDADGNYNDPDDWAATPLELALLANRGLQSKLVHYSWANIIGPNDSDFYYEMKISTLGAAERFGFARSKFFDCQNDLQAAITHLRNQINASTAEDPLFILALGPMEVLWRAVSASNSAKRQYVTVISHTEWNATKTYPPTMTRRHSWCRALCLVLDLDPFYSRRLDRPRRPGAWCLVSVMRRGRPAELS
jgi:hypothetical protein